jgi:glutaredoxin
VQGAGWSRAVLALLAAMLVLALECRAQPTPLLPGCAVLEVFYQEGCPHCERARKYLDALQREIPELELRYHDVAASAEERERFVELNMLWGVDRPGVPSMLVCGQLLVGFSPADSPAAIRGRLLGAPAASPPAAPPRAGSSAPGEGTGPAAAGDAQIELPLIGTVSLARVGLPLFTLAIGALDGFNPCAMWVLLFLLSLLLNLRSRRRMLLVAGTFVLVSGIVYFAFMAAWLNLFLLLGASRILQAAVAVMALLIGAVHLKDFFAAGQGVTLGIPDAAKPGLYARVRAIVQAENLPAAMVLVTVMAVMVNLVELLCTAGLPALYTRILTLQQMPAAEYYGYLLLYNLAYVFDDALMLAVVVITLERAKLNAGQGRWLKLVSGTTVLMLGLALLFAPQLLF